MYLYVRDEGLAIALPAAEELAAHVANGGATVDLYLYYSAKNQDNMLSTNISLNISNPLFNGYALVQGVGNNGGGKLRIVAAKVFATQPQSDPHIDYVPLDLYWDDKRKDFQTVGSAESRKWLSKDYVLVARLGWVAKANNAPPGKKIHDSGLKSPHSLLLSFCRSCRSQQV